MRDRCAVRGCLFRMLALLSLFGTGCERVDPTLLVSIPPPQRWGEELAQGRRAKDLHFRESAESPLLADERADFKGLDYWADAPTFYFVGSVELYETRVEVPMLSTAGEPMPSERIGRVRFKLQGELNTLQVYRMLETPTQPGSPGFFLPFMDGTTGKESYPAGRYVELEGPPGGPYVLDFNRAYNPYCAYGAVDRYACPRTPSENRIAVRIEAGERGFRHPPGKSEAGAEP